MYIIENYFLSAKLVYRLQIRVYTYDSETVWSLKDIALVSGHQQFLNNENRISKETSKDIVSSYLVILVLEHF